jgi:hypothetical protein
VSRPYEADIRRSNHWSSPRLRLIGQVAVGRRLTTAMCVRDAFGACTRCTACVTSPSSHEISPYRIPTPAGVSHQTPDTAASDEREVSCSTDTVLLLCMEASVSAAAWDGLEAAQDPFRGVTGSLPSKKKAHLQDSLTTAVGLDRAPLPIRDDTAMRPKSLLCRDFKPSAGLEPAAPSLPWPRSGGEFLGGIPHEYWVFGHFVSSLPDALDRRKLR